ncbi:MAG TPA: hypothetical protein DCS93_06535 [Microscillaceae bacterium]|nr:hypothetical protein [Microscillaceae bacterium]
MSKIEVSKISTLTGHRDCVYALAPSQQSNIFFSADGNGLVARWDLAKPEIGDMVAKVQNSVYALHYLEANDQLLVGHNFEGLHLIDLASKTEVKSIKLTGSQIFDIQSIGNLILAACGDGVVIALDFDNWAVRKHLKASDKSARVIAVHPDQKSFAVGYSDHQVRVFDTESLDLLHTIPAHQNSVFALRYSPDGAFLLSGSRDAHLKVWDVAQDYQLHESVVAHMYALNSIAFSPDGRYFITGSMDKSIKVWETATFKLRKVIDRARHAGHGTSVNKLWWSPYQNYIVSGSDDRTVSVWSLKFP